MHSIAILLVWCVDEGKQDVIENLKVLLLILLPTLYGLFVGMHYVASREISLKTVNYTNTWSDWTTLLNISFVCMRNYIVVYLLV